MDYCILPKFIENHIDKRHRLTLTQGRWRHLLYKGYLMIYEDKSGCLFAMFIWKEDHTIRKFLKNLWVKTAQRKMNSALERIWQELFKVFSHLKKIEHLERTGYTMYWKLIPILTKKWDTVKVSIILLHFSFFMSKRMKMPFGVSKNCSAESIPGEIFLETIPLGWWPYSMRLKPS